MGRIDFRRRAPGRCPSGRARSGRSRSAGRVFRAADVGDVMKPRMPAPRINCPARWQGAFLEKLAGVCVAREIERRGLPYSRTSGASSWSCGSEPSHRCHRATSASELLIPGGNLPLQATRKCLQLVDKFPPNENWSLYKRRITNTSLL